MNEKRWDVLAIGNAAVDELIYLDGYPAADSKQPILDVQRQGGGLSATALVAAARQGARAAFCCLIGSDELSAFTLDDLAREKVDCSPCLVSPEGRPYHAFILVDRQKQTRTILYYRGVVEPPVDHITPELIASTRVLFYDHHAPLAGAKAARLARKSGIPVVADLEKTDLPNLDELLTLTDHLIVGQGFAAHLTGRDRPEDMLRQLASNGRACTVVTAGDQGCWYSLSGGPATHYPAFPVDVVDTTGCGDVFHGAYAASLARGRPVRRAIEVATASAALKAAQPGGRSGIPSLPAVRDFLRERLSETIWEHLEHSPIFQEGSAYEELEVSFSEVKRYYTQIARLILEKADRLRRTVVAVAGPPGSGKSSFAAILNEAVNALAGEDRAALVGLDGWHYPNAYLDSHTIQQGGSPIPLRARKGSPETFDVAAVRSFLEHLGQPGPLTYPVYSRKLHDAVPDGGTLAPGQDIAILEGNYWLLDEEPWRSFRPLFDLTIFLRADPEPLLDGLRQRHLRGQKAPADVEQHLEYVDLPNIRRVLAHSVPADITIQKSDSRNVLFFGTTIDPKE